MAKFCLNCNTRNARGRIRCKECGASLARALEVRDAPNLVPWLVVIGVIVVLLVLLWVSPSLSMVTR